jgi:hypothetical protein
MTEMNNAYNRVVSAIHSASLKILEKTGRYIEITTAELLILISGSGEKEKFLDLKRDFCGNGKMGDTK